MTNSMKYIVTKKTMITIIKIVIIMITTIKIIIIMITIIVKIIQTCLV